MTILELIAIRDFLTSLYSNPEDETHPSIAECATKFKQLKGQYKISNEDVCQFLSEKTKSKWSYEIKTINDYDNDNLFCAKTKSLTLTFASKSQSFCAIGMPDINNNRDVLENVNWFDIMLTMQTDRKQQKTVALPNGTAIIVKGNVSPYQESKMILFDTLIEKIGKISVEEVLEKLNHNSKENKDEGKK